MLLKQFKSFVKTVGIKLFEMFEFKRVRFDRFICLVQLLFEVLILSQGGFDVVEREIRFVKTNCNLKEVLVFL